MTFICGASHLGFHYKCMGCKTNLLLHKLKLSSVVNPPHPNLKQPLLDFQASDNN